MVFTCRVLPVSFIQFSVKMAGSNLFEIVPTRAMMMLQSGVNTSDFKVTVFESRKKTSVNESEREKRSATKERDDNTSRMRDRSGRPTEDTEFDMKRARHEVINFGLNGFESKDKKRAQIDLAVKLGAKPPRGAYKNYKDLLAEKNQEKAEKEDEKKLLQLGKNQMGVASVKCGQSKNALRKRKKKLGEISTNYGVVKPQIFKKRKRN